jgi:hypothetical protein
MLGKRLRYTMTRLCLDSGSIALLKYMEPFIPTEGSFSFVLDNGRDLKLSLGEDNRIYGLGDYFRAQGLNVNDTLFITPLEERKLQLEAVTKDRESVPRASSVAAAKPATERIVEHESEFVREVREVRIAAVSPYPNGIMFPQQNGAQSSGATGGQQSAAQRTDSSHQQKGMQQHAQQQQSANLEKPAVPSSPSLSSPPPLPLMLPSQTAPVNQSAKLEETSSVVTSAADVFASVGYNVTKLETGLLLETRLGRLGHRVAVGFEGAESDAVLKAARVQGVKYLAVVAAKERLGLVNVVSPFGRVARVELEALEALRTLQERFNVTPLELEGYWNAEGISSEALESLQENATSRLESKGVFSFVTLALKHFDAPCILTPEDIAAKLPASGISTGTIIETLETLCKAPFNILTPVGLGEYHLKTPLERGLTELSEYVSSLRLHLRGSGVQKADALMTAGK